MNEECQEAIYGNEYLDLIVEYNEELESIYNQFETACIQFLNFRYVIVHLDGNIYPPYSISMYGYQKIPKCFGLMDTSALDESGIIRVQELPSLDLRGRNVLIGFVDTGIDYTNPLFQNADGTTRIVSIWDQTIRDGETPTGFLYGTEYERAQINEALQNENPTDIVPSMDENGHGTFVAGVCAGSRDEDREFIGGAPDAELVVVKLKEAKESLKQFQEIYVEEPIYQENDIMMGVQYLIKIARRERKPIVIYLGVGTNQGGKEGADPLGNLLSTISQAAGACIVTVAGNESLARGHYYGGGMKGDRVETVEINVGDEQGFTLELWGKSPNTYSVAIRSPGGEVIQRIQPGLSESREVQLILERTRVRVDYQLVESGTGDEVIVMSFRNPTRGLWMIDVYLEELDDSGFHMWLPISNFITEETYFIRADPDTTLVSPGTNPAVITFTAYNHENNSLYLEASRGYGRACGIKPDMAAPGVNVLGPNLRKGYTRKTGSSVAAAIGASACALLMEWGVTRGNVPDMGTNEIKKLLIRGAIRNGERIYPNREWGYGRINLYETFQRLTRL